MEKKNMETLQEAIQKITFQDKKFPKKEFEIIRMEKDAAIPYLRQAVEKALLEQDKLDENYQLHFYALFLLGEFQDKEFFPEIIKLALLPGDTLDMLIGDAVTSGLPDILYNTYNGDLELLKNIVKNKENDEFVRSGILNVLGQLYLDGTMEKEEWRQFLKSMADKAEEYDPIYNSLAAMICRCHFIEMLPEIRRLYEHNLIDEGYVGGYDAHVDYMFEYRDYEQNFCESPMDAAEYLKNWAMFEPEEDRQQEQNFEKMFRQIKNEYTKTEKKQKIGRNDPCPCGSGKKYKFCCLNKPKSPLDVIESEQERKKWLKNYPETGSERMKDRIYLEDYFDQENIEFDKILYLALMHRAIPIWERDEKEEERRTRAYLKLAYSKFVEKVETEQIRSFAEYDKKYAIHYYCEDWFEALLAMGKKDEDELFYEEAAQCYERMKKVMYQV